MISSHRHIPIAFSLLSAGHAVEIDDGYTLLDTNALLTKGRDGCLAFIVTGDSMREGLLPGFIVVIDPNREPRNGDAVAVSVNNELCVKIFERQAQRLYLVPQNGDYPVREVRPVDALHILGVVTGHLALY